MKREYKKPCMYTEVFLPNEYAAGCKPGVKEDEAKPYYAECWYVSHGYSGCSNDGETLAILTEKNQGCQIKLTSSGGTTADADIEDCMHDFEADGIGSAVPAYRWNNGQNYWDGTHGWHYIAKSQFGGTATWPGPNGSTESGPYYFNS